MKKSGNLFKVTAFLVACFVLLISNPLNTQAGRWSCFWGSHNIKVKSVSPATCQEYAYSEAYCADCGLSIWIERDYSRRGPHCYSTDPYQAPKCQYCGHRRY